MPLLGSGASPGLEGGFAGALSFLPQSLAGPAKAYRVACPTHASHLHSSNHHLDRTLAPA